MSTRQTTGGVGGNLGSDGYTDYERIELYRERVTRLLACRLLRAEFKVELSIHFVVNRPVAFTEKPVDEDELSSFLLLLRPLYLKKEPAFVSRVVNICDRRIDSDELRGYLRSARAQWKQALVEGPLRIVIRGKDFTPEYITDLLINGYYFHSDAEKRRELHSIPLLARPLTRHLFLDHMVVATRYVKYVRDFITVAGRQGVLRC